MSVANPVAAAGLERKTDKRCVAKVARRCQAKHVLREKHVWSGMHLLDEILSVRSICHAIKRRTCEFAHTQAQPRLRWVAQEQDAWMDGFARRTSTLSQRFPSVKQTGRQKKTWLKWSRTGAVNAKGTEARGRASPGRRSAGALRTTHLFTAIVVVVVFSPCLRARAIIPHR
eukprot:3272348-Pleurochrysis_carterae.AAC.6